MAILKRTKKESVLPEVDQYYDGERRDRAGLAWLLALISVVLVALVIIGVFWAGRWAYRQITGSNDGATVSEVEVEEGELTFDGTVKPTEGDDMVQQDNNDENASDQDEDTAPRTNEASGQQTAIVPATGDNTSLPSTGPTSTIAVFAAVSTLAGAAHHVINRKRVSNK